VWPKNARHGLDEDHAGGVQACVVMKSLHLGAGTGPNEEGAEEDGRPEGEPARRALAQDLGHVDGSVQHLGDDVCDVDGCQDWDCGGGGRRRKGIGQAVPVMEAGRRGRPGWWGEPAAS
jgi:hypothetical protein